MDQVELAVDPGPLGQLDQEAVPDFDADGFDFQLDGVYDQADENQQDAPAVITKNVVDQVDEIGYEDDEEEAQSEHAATNSAEDEDPPNELAGDEIAATGLEYQEEIGYEEDYSLTTEAVKADENAQDLAVADAEQPEYQAEDELDPLHEDQPEYEAENQAEPQLGDEPEFEAEDQSEPQHEDEPEYEAEDQIEPQHEDQPEYEADEQPSPQHDNSSGQPQIHAQEDQAVSLNNIESEKPMVEEDLDDQLDHDDDDNDDDDDEKEKVPELGSHSDMDYEAGSNHADGNEDYLMDDDEEPRGGLSEVDKAIEDLASSLHGVPDIEVFYNDVNYSLFGTANDDPDAYFLSDVKKMDEPLAQFLSSLRQVIANEIAPTDTLLVSFDSLDLEFGERSSERFLSRTLRELLDCHAALAAKDTAIASVPVLQLIVQHDCEERFLQLLDEAKYGGESPCRSGSVLSEHEHSEHTESNHQNGWVNEELLVDEDDNTAHNSYENETPVNGIASSHDQSRNPCVSPAVENDATTQNEDAAISSTHSQSPELAAEGQPDHDDQVVHQATLETVHAEDSNTLDFSQEQVSYESVDVHVDEQEMKDADEAFDVITELETTEEAQLTSNGVFELTTGSNDNDLLLAFDQDGGLSTIDEQEGDGGQGGEILNGVLEVTNSAADNNEDALETDWQAEISQVSRGMSPTVSKDPQQGPSASATGDTASDHTSTTMNGDEIDYDENDGADDSFTPDNSAPHSVAAPVEDGDEIDWGNDGDEYEEVHDEAEGDITFEPQPDLDLAPSSPTGKRYRTDDAESLAEESDHKRRRT
ncbi:Putative protein of unknown function [Podospora comata]|uniref:Uncharacterized protein n=1 Tax=Podospora comata TaxID=48703 RepID=A0ABY6SLK7_PODCO|nr:Putative protein of unknown function [Podospora comata]